MPNVPDGSVVIETELDTGKVSDGIGQLEKLLKELSRSVNSLTKAINTQFGGIAKSSDTAKTNVEDLNEELDKTAKKRCAKVDITTDASKINAQISELEKKVSDLSYTDTNLLDSGGGYDIPESALTGSQRLAELDVAKEKLLELKTQLAELERKNVNLLVDVNTDTTDLDAGISEVSDSFKVATDAAGLLEQKFNNINRQIAEQQSKIAALEKEYQSAVNAGASEDTLAGISSKITTAQSKLISLQETANKTSDKIAKIKTDAEKQDIEIEVTADTSQAEKTVDKSSNQIISNSNKTANEIAKKSSETGQKVKHDFEDTGSRSAVSLETLAARAKSAFGKLTAAMAAAFSVKVVIDFGKSAVSAANEAANALQGLQSIMEGQGRSFADATGWIQDYISDGLIPMQNAVTAYKNLAARGYDDAQIRSVLTALKDSAAYGRQASYSLGDAVTTATEGIKNENSILVDNAGVTKNVAKMWDDYAKSIGTSSNKLTQQQKIQAEVNGILEETKFQQGDAAKISEGFSGQLSRLSYAFNELKVTIGNVLIQAVTPIIKALGDGITKLTYFVKQLSELMGINTDTLNSGAAESASNVAKSTSEVADNYADAAESAEAAAEANENSLASFDKVNKLSDEGNSKSSSDNIASTELPDMSGLAAGAAAVSVGIDVDIEGAVKKLESFLKSFKSIFKSAKSYFKQNFSGIFEGIFDDLSEEFGELKATISGIGIDLSTLADPLKKYLGGDFTIYLQTVVSTVGQILAGLFDSFNNVFSDTWDVAVFPVLSNFLTVGLPMITQFATQIWQTIGTLFDNVKKIFDTGWSEGIKPVLDTLSRAWCDIINTMSDSWNKWGEPIFENIRSAIRGTTNTLLSIWDETIKPLLDYALELVDEVWTEHLQPLLANVLDFVGEVVNGALEIYNEAILPIINWLVDKLSPVIVKVKKTIMRIVTTVIESFIDTVDGVITTLKGFAQFISGVFTMNWDKAWHGIKNIFKGIWDSFSSIVKTPINLIIDLINSLLGGIESALNNAIDAINSISIDLPDAVADVVGFDSIGFNIGTVDIPDIPKLATGTVVPANYGEFMAILGDNKRETEVVSPLSTIRQAVAEALAAKGGAGGEIVIDNHIHLSDKEIHRSVVKVNKQQIRKTGRNPLAT